jgi:hypothetical protein
MNFQKILKRQHNGFGYSDPVWPCCQVGERISDGSPAVEVRWVVLDHPNKRDRLMILEMSENEALRMAIELTRCAFDVQRQKGRSGIRMKTMEKVC